MDSMSTRSNSGTWPRLVPYNAITLRQLFDMRTSIYRVCMFDMRTSIYRICMTAYSIARIGSCLLVNANGVVKSASTHFPP
jgi:hypothetical protein